MLGRLLLIFGSIWLVQKSICSAQQFEKKKRAINYGINGCGDRISALPDDLLVQNLLLVPTKDAVATMILSKRWLYVWTMVPCLEYRDIKDLTYKKRFLGGLLGLLFGKSERRPQSIWRFLNESLRRHKAPIMESLIIKLGPHCPVDANVEKWIANAVDRRVRELAFNLMWSAEPVSLPNNLYICDTLVYLHLSNKVFVDVSSQLVCLSSLKYLDLVSVVYKDGDSLVRLLSSCPILKYLWVARHDQDNVTKFSVRVPSLETLTYKYVQHEYVQDMGRSLVIDSANLKEFTIVDYWTNSWSIENKPRLDKAAIYSSYLDDKFMISLSPVKCLEIGLSVETIACFHTINFSQLIECKIRPYELDWFEPLVSLLQNSPKLKVLVIDQEHFKNGDFILSFNKPSHAPLCLSKKLEIFEWIGYGGRREEKEIVRYIFANSKRLKRAGISLKSRGRTKTMKELKSMYRISTSSQLLFSTQLEFNVS